MPPQISLSTATLHGFLLVLTRVSFTFVFAPMPQLKQSSTTLRIVLSLAVTIALQSVWPAAPVSMDRGAEEIWKLLARLAGEAGLGIAIGLVVSLLSDAVTLSMQILGIQAGFGYASTIDPNSEADSGVLVVLAQLAAWLLFLTFGLERHLIRALAASLEAYPAGSYALPAGARAAVLTLGSAIFPAALRLALPVVALLMLVDIAFALFGRLHAQLQLLSLAFPAKMLAALAMLALLSPAFPRADEAFAAKGVAALLRLGGN
jgi:flagellar biosynthetic protein FliR